jgi:hypothetical protein
MDQQDHQALEFLSSELTLVENRLYEHISTTFRWLMATLVTANGGAIVALLSEGANLRGTENAVAWFAAGLVLSLLMGVLSAFWGHRAIPAITKARSAIRQGLIMGDITPAKQAVEDLLAQQRPTWKTWVPTYAGLGSLACFVIGLITIALSVLC